MNIDAVLFDLDGTFADTAPDLTRALNIMRASRDLPPVALSVTRPVTSTGARGMLGVGFGLTPEHADFAAMREEFLGHYAQNLCVETAVFPGMHELLDEIEARGLAWGIVTNKAERFAKPLIEQMQFAGRCACLIGGDTTGKLKPSPEPLLAAARLIGRLPAACIYVGDDRRDIEAGRAAGMKTIAVRYGYLNGSEPEGWGADYVIDTPLQVMACL